jgi:SagB-type dehydrogenase family enzyme
MPFATILRVLQNNQRITRRQAFQVGGLFGGLLLFLLSPFRAKTVSAKGRAIVKEEDAVKLPKAVLEGTVSVEKAIKQRRTVRAFADQPLTVEELAQVLWAAQGVTEDRGFKRAAPSGGALYPIDVWAVVGKGGVENLGQGVYRYEPAHHVLSQVLPEDARVGLASASLGQMWIATAPVVLVLTAEYPRITGKYGERGRRYAMIEVGHIGENIFLQCGALGLGAGIVGAFSDKEVARVLKVEKNQEPLIIMPVGLQP